MTLSDSEAPDPLIEPARVLVPLVSDDTFAVGYLDLATLTQEVLAELVSMNHEWKTHESLPEDKANEIAQQGIGYLSKSRVRFIYVVAGVEDIHRDGGPLLFAPLPEDGDALLAREVLQSFIQLLSMFDRGHSAYAKLVRAMRAEWHESRAIWAATHATKSRYCSNRPQNRPDLLTPLSQSMAAGKTLAIVLSPGQDARRVLRELWPQLPESFDAVTGPLLADELQHAEVDVRTSPEISLGITVSSSNAASAQVFKQAIEAIPDLIATAIQPSDYAGALQPRIDEAKERMRVETYGVRTGGRIEMDFRLQTLGSHVVRLMTLMREFGYPLRRVNQLRTLAIAMQNYHDVNKRFPASAEIKDRRGNPLLSWRVAILPYAEEQSLYKQFHLNEPWNSEHNRKLIELMPAIFADPDPKWWQLAREGKTTYQVPVGAETVFYKNEGTSLREITDGTSRTIMIVEVEPSRAVEWTKPQDWEVDMEHPRQGLERSDRDQFVAAWCDASVRTIPVGIEEAKLRAHLTRAGREIVDRP